MGDLRADIKIQMSMWGHKYKTEFWINYWDDGDGNDARVKEWFNDCYQKSMSKYYAQMDKIRDEAREQDEKAYYERLKAKYEVNTATKKSRKEA